MLIGTDEGDWDHVWYVSSYIQHMSHSRATFNSIVYKDRLEYVGGIMVDTYGIGEVCITSGSKNYQICDVLFCPEISVNVLSLTQLNAQGLKIEVVKDKCMLQIKDANIGNSSSVYELFQEDRSNTEKDMVDRISKQLIDGRNSNSLMPEVLSILLPTNLHGIEGIIDLALKVEQRNYRALSKHFDRMLEWFYSSELCDDSITLPVTIGPKQLDLLSLFKTVKEQGGAGMVTLKEEWSLVAMALGFPEWYEGKIKTTFVKYLQKVDVCYDILKGLDSLDEYQVVIWKDEEVNIRVKDHKTFITYMEMIQENQMAMKHIKKFRNTFDEVMYWLHRNYVNQEIEIPPKIEGFEVCLFDLYVLINNADDIGSIEWGNVAQSFGFEEDKKDEFRALAKTYLEIPQMLFKEMIEDDSGMHEACYAPQEDYAGDMRSISDQQVFKKQDE